MPSSLLIAARLEELKVALAQESDPGAAEVIADEMASAKRAYKKAKKDEGDDEDDGDKDKDPEEDDEEAKKAKATAASQAAPSIVVEDDSTAAMSVYREVVKRTGKTGTSALGALSALLDEHMGLKGRIQSLEARGDAAELRELIADNLRRKMITPAESKKLAARNDLAFAKSYVSMRDAPLVGTEDRPVVERGRRQPTGDMMGGSEYAGASVHPISRGGAAAQNQALADANLETQLTEVEASHLDMACTSNASINRAALAADLIRNRPIASGNKY